jgi:predicted  nucleic acid-binding Zn-ribbon protein
MTDRDHFAAAATDDQSEWLRHAIASDKITIAELEAEIERLREAIRRLADQDATLSVQGGNVTVTLDATLTDEEREAIREACDEGRWYPKDYHHIHTLRCLLERLF